MMHSTYLRYEILRTFRNRRFMIFSLAVPLAIFLLVAGPNRHIELGGIPFALYYMTGMIAYGGMIAVLSSGGRIANERTTGWTRQMRITPLSVRVYFRTKVATGYLMALLTIAVLYVAGLSFGVRLSAGEWLTMTGLLLVGLVPFAVLGILLGHLLNPDSLGPAIGGVTAFFALLGGVFGPLASTGALHTLAEGLPSYWLVQAGHTALGGRAWPANGWIVVALWTAVAGRLAMLAYRRDTNRV